MLRVSRNAMPKHTEKNTKKPPPVLHLSINNDIPLALKQTSPNPPPNLQNHLFPRLQPRKQHNHILLPLHHNNKTIPHAEPYKHLVHENVPDQLRRYESSRAVSLGRPSLDSEAPEDQDRFGCVYPAEGGDA